MNSRITAAVLALALVSPLRAEPVGTAHREYERLAGEFAQQLASLAKAAPAEHQQLLRDWVRPSESLVDRIYVAPDCYSPEPAAAQLTTWEAEDAPVELTQAAAARREFSQAVVALAVQSAQDGDGSLAMRLLHRALREDAGNRRARALLGYQQVDDEWLTPTAARMARGGRIWNAQYGWIRSGDLPRYEAGERFSGGRWISSELDASRHARIDDGWQLRTDHFVVTTNHSLPAGALLATRLEQLHKVWWQLFGDIVVDDSALRKAMDRNRAIPQSRRLMQVVYHRDKQQYVDKLRHRQANIAVTLGIYFDRYREAHFYAGGDDAEATLYHEATHQLFQESLDSVRSAGRASDFWAIEAAALYFESLQVDADPSVGTSFRMGGVDGGRLPAARYRWVESGYRVPLAELVALGQNDLQSRSDLSPLYSQLAGLGHFFLSPGDNDRRHRFSLYIKAIYEGDAAAGSLAESLGTSLDELDRRYGDWIESLDEVANSADSPP